MRVLILLALVGTALAVPKSVQRIVGGEPTTIDQYPYMSNMQYHWLGWIWMQWCGGSLISNYYVLSAAHCYEGDRADQWNVRFGSSSASSGGNVVSVLGIIMHPEYDRPTPLDNDVALIRLQNSVSNQPAAIPSYNFNPPDDTSVTSIGWGALSQGGGSPDQLQHVEVYTINQGECARRYAFLKTQPGYQNWPDITDGMLCAGILDVGGKDACQGDSGGPLALTAQRNTVIGITSWGFGCADATYPGVNARVSYYSDWIAANTQN